MNEYTDFIAPLKNPSEIYGEVPFYWFSGERLDKARLRGQLEALAANGIAGVQINYAHQFRGGEKDEVYGGAGRSIPGEPYQFSEEWWDFFGYAANICEELGLGIGVGDYSLAWIGNGFFTDKVASTEGMNAETLSAERQRVFGIEDVNDPDSVLAVISFSDPLFSKPEVLFERGKKTGFPYGCYDAFIIRTKTVPLSIDPLNDNSGKMLTDIYFGEFERRFPGLKKGTLNFFFQDELLFGVDVKRIWRENLREAIREKYGYDPLGFLPHLFYVLSPLTAKIRLDYADVKTELMEENYFKPVYDFHARRGMIYGCDQSSRGRQPDEFSDYFRTVRWFTAPGNDTPGRAADMIKVKVNSSIAELYGRPRVWLEGYHSSGWGTSLESITAPTSDNFMFGANLLNLHGLYYTTNGGFFEWAPPDFHFRMPYWDDEKVWLSKYKSLSAMLTTGRHVCDAAVFYPVSSCDYGENAEQCVNDTFSTAEYLFDSGLDFTFIDFQSILRAEVKNGKLVLPEAEFSAIVLCSADCVRYPVMEKLRDFAASCGCVVFKSITPYLTDLAPEHREELEKTNREILSFPGCGLCSSPAEVLSFINSRITRLFLPDREDTSEKTRCTARKTETQTLFFTRGCSKDTVCRFHASGQPFLLDSYNKKIYRLTGTVSANGFTFIKMPLDGNDDTLILITDDYIRFDAEINTAGFDTPQTVREYRLDGEWEFSLLPTLDNRYGDFYKPAGGMIGAQARFFKAYCENGEDKAVRELPYCRSLDVFRINAPGDVFDACRRLSARDSRLPDDASPLPLHDRYGYVHPRANDGPALYEQGYHGLKGRVYDHNMYFSGDSVFVTDVFCEHDTEAYFYLTGIRPDVICINGEKAEDHSAPVYLPAGRSRLAAGFLYDENLRPDFINRSSLKRAGVYLTKTPAPHKTGYELSVTPFANPDFLPFVSPEKTDDVFVFEFTAVPGTYGFEGTFFGELLEAGLDGAPMDIKKTGKGNFGGEKYTAIGSHSEHSPRIRLKIKTDGSKSFTGMIPEPVNLLCSDGKAVCGDLCLTGALKNFSGKAVYKKTAQMKKYSGAERFFLSLGEVGVTAEVKINGETAHVFTYAPFECEITDLVRDGDNEITVTVSNTLCNHYSTVPSGYSNFPDDSRWGLIGPVVIRVSE